MAQHVYGRYQVIERIAVGGMAEIFLGRVKGVEGFERPVVIKKVRRRYSRDDRFHSMLIREAKITATLGHPNIVQILDLGQNDRQEYFIVMEYVDGWDLRSCMDRARMEGVSLSDRTPARKGSLSDRTPARKGSLPLEEMVYLALELCAALDYAHRKTDEEGRSLNLIHRDVSPANVLVSASGEVKLADFGIARYGRDVSAVGSLKGKLGYMSPEQARAEPVDLRSDIFSVGAVLFEAALGRRPFAAQTDLDLLQQVQAAEITPPSSVDPNVPSELERILLKAMAPEPRDRYPSAEHLAAALRRFQFNRSATRVGPERLASLLRRLFGSSPPAPPGKRTEARFTVNTVSGVGQGILTGMRNPLFGQAITSTGKPSEVMLGEMMKDLQTDELGLEEYEPAAITDQDLPDATMGEQGALIGAPTTDPAPAPIDNVATDPMGFSGGVDLMKIVTNILLPETIDDLARQTRGPRRGGALDDVATVAPEAAELEAIARSMPELAIRNAPSAGEGAEEPPTPPPDDEASDAGSGHPIGEISTPAVGVPGLVAPLARPGAILLDHDDELPTPDLDSEVLEVDDVAVELPAAAGDDRVDEADEADEAPTPPVDDAPLAAVAPALPGLADDDDDVPTSVAGSTAAPLSDAPAPAAADVDDAAPAEPDPVLPPAAAYIAPARRRKGSSWVVWPVVALVGLVLGGGGATVLLLRPFELQLTARPPLSSDAGALVRTPTRRPGPGGQVKVVQPVAKQPAAKQPAAKQPAAKQPAAKEPATKQPAAAKPAAKQPAAKQPATAAKPAAPATVVDPKPVAKEPTKVADAKPAEEQPGDATTRQPGTSASSSKGRPRRTGGESDAVRTPGLKSKRGKRGQVVIKSDPWAYIHVDGKRSMRTTSARPFSLSAGKHTIVLVNPKLGLRKSLEIEVEAGGLVRRFVRLQ